MRMRMRARRMRKEEKEKEEEEKKEEEEGSGKMTMLCSARFICFLKHCYPTVKLSFSKIFYLDTPKTHLVFHWGPLGAL